MKTLRFGLTLVRHGETQFNRDGLLQGQTVDPPLSDVGLLQSQSAGRFLSHVNFTNVFVSDMLRAQQTAEAIMKLNVSCLNLHMVSEPLLKEKSFGSAEGGRVEDMKEMARAAGQSFLDFTPPGGETQEEVRKRVKEFMDKLVQTMGHEHWTEDQDEVQVQVQVQVPVQALVVSHGVLLRALVRHLVEELRCRPPPGCNESDMFSLSPNAGSCRFIVSLKRRDDGEFRVHDVTCVFVHRRGDDDGK